MANIHALSHIDEVAGQSASSPKGQLGQAGSSILLTDEDAANLLRISVRKFHELRPLLSLEPVVLGPRCVRYVRTELEASVINLPRQQQPEEPRQLLRARIERQRATGAPA